MISPRIIAHWTCMRPQLFFRLAEISSSISIALKGVVALGLLAILSGCVYRMNIQQGNFLEGRTVDQLQAGMTRSQVRYLLGTPMVPDAFDRDRWDYLYYFKKGRLTKPEERHLIVYFHEDKVDKFEKNNVPAKAPQGPEEGPSVSKFPVM
jgi:outer membrane protein assembly factor BamE